MMSNFQKLGVGISGLGVGERHARIVSSLPDTELRQIYDPNHEKSANLAVELNTVSANSFTELLNDPNIDVIIIASPDHFHEEQIVKALKAKKHVFAEKPLCNTGVELQSIADSWKEHNSTIKLYSNLILRIAPLYQWLKTKVDEDFFGDIFAFDGDYLYGRKEKILFGWRGTGENYSGMKGGGIHLIDMMCWLTGQRPKSVITMGNDIATRKSEVVLNDYMSAMFRFESGLVGRVTANLGCVHRHHHVIRIFGTKATFIYDDGGPRVHLHSDPSLSAVNVDLDPLPKGKSDIIPVFLNAVRNGIDTDMQTKETFDIVSILAASDLSVITGVEEQINYL